MTFIKHIAEWLMVRVIGGLAVTFAITAMWLSFTLTKGLDFLP